MNFLNQWDHEVTRAINLLQPGKLIDYFMLFLSSEEIWSVFVLLFLIALCVNKRTDILKPLSFAIVCLMICDAVSYRILKPNFERLRPCYQYEDMRVVQHSCGSDYGFPSNHAGNSTALMLGYVLITRRKKLLKFFPFVLLVAYSRVYLGVHFVGDVLFGMFVGGIIALLTYGVYTYGKKTIFLLNQKAST